MVVLCPNCQSRYQLSDDKIRPTGTKVRCPRCQNAFKVFPQANLNAPSSPPPPPAPSPPPVQRSASREPANKTEFFVRKPPAKVNPIGQQPMGDEEEATPSTQTRPPLSPPERQPSPFRKASQAAVRSSTRPQIADEDDGSEETTKTVKSTADELAGAFSDERTRVAAGPAPAKPSARSIFSRGGETGTDQDVLKPKPVAQIPDEETETPAGRQPSPFRQPTASAEAPSEEDSLENIPRATDLEDKVRMSEVSHFDHRGKASSKRAAPPADAEPRPFGDETFMEIQKLSGPRRGGSKRFIAAAAVVIVVIAGFFAVSHIPHQESSGPVARKDEDSKAPGKNRGEDEEKSKSGVHLSVRRPAQWYKDEPSVFQDFLSQMAALPPTEQQKPEVRSVIAEALISNGFLTGSDDQIASGLGYASGLLARYPTTVYGFYGLSTYSLWKDDIQTLLDLTRRWPTENQTDPEFRLAKLVAEGRVFENARGALEEGKALLTDYSDFSRARLAVFSIALDAYEDAQRILGDHSLDDLAKYYQKRRETFKRGQSLPPLFASIDKKIVRQQKKENLVAKAAKETAKAKEKEAEKERERVEKEKIAEREREKAHERELAKEKEKERQQELARQKEQEREAAKARIAARETAKREAQATAKREREAQEVAKREREAQAQAAAAAAKRQREAQELAKREAEEAAKKRAQAEAIARQQRLAAEQAAKRAPTPIPIPAPAESQSVGPAPAPEVPVVPPEPTGIAKLPLDSQPAGKVDKDALAIKESSPEAPSGPVFDESKLNAKRDPLPTKKITKLPKPAPELIAMNKQNRKDKSEAEKYFELGNTRFKQDKTSEALEAYQKALRLNPDFAEVYKRLGQIYMGRKDKEKALRSFKIYLQLKPESEDKQLVEGWISSLQ